MRPSGPLHFSVERATTTGWRITTTKRARGWSACRKRLITRLGGDFSSSSRRSRSQCCDHEASIRAALASLTSGDSSVRWERGSKANRPAPP